MRLTLIDRPDVVLEARLTDASPVVDPATATGRVKALVLTPPGPDLLLRAALVGHLQIEDPPAIHIPAAALTSTTAGAAVWTVDPAAMTVRLTPVTVTGFGAEDVMVSAGLTEGDLVVGAGSQLLYPGGAVIKAEVSE